MSDESSEESDDPLYGEDSSLTEGESSDEYSSGELRRRVVCSGSSSSTDLDSSSTSESYDEDDSDPEDIKFNSGSIRKKSSGFKTTPENIKTFLKADPVLNGSEIIRGSQKLDFSSKNLGFKGGPGKKKSFEWSTSESSEEDLGTKSGLKQSRSQVDEPKKSNDPNDLTIAFSVQETMRAAALSKLEKEEKSEKEIGYARPKVCNSASVKKPSTSIKPKVSSDDKKTISKFKTNSVDNRTTQDTNLFHIEGKTNRKPVSNKKLISASSTTGNNKKLSQTSPGRNNKRTLIKR